MNNLTRYAKNIRAKKIVDAKFNADSKEYRHDGYINLLTQYGTNKDSSTAYEYIPDFEIPDMDLTNIYAGNGLFARIIDAPADEALRKGYDFGLNNPDVTAFLDDEFDRLDWEDKAALALKWSRLYGGAVIVMIVDDGCYLTEPLDWDNVKAVEDLRVYERAVVEPDYHNLYSYEPGSDKGKRYGSKFLEPEYYTINSVYGRYRVHESRCLVFRNGKLPENCMSSNYRFFGYPEYLRLKDALKNTTVSHDNGVKLLERCVQGIYKMKQLAQKVATDKGTEEVLKRIELIDLARGILNTLVIDAEGEEYDFKSMPLSGVKDIIDSTCNMLSALTKIPQTILFGRSPAGENSTGESDFESYYDYIEKIQKRQLKKPTRVLVDLICTCGIRNGDINEIPPYKVKFNPLWSLSETEKANVDAVKATTEQTKAATAQIYVDMQALDPTEIREGLKKNEEYTINDLLNEEEDLDLGELLGIGGNMPEETITEEQQNKQERNKNPLGIQNTNGYKKIEHGARNKSTDTNTDEATKEYGGVGVIVIENGRILVANRTDGKGICGPGGHIERGETPRQAAIRETIEEFNIIPKDLIPLGKIEGMQHELGSHIFLCTSFDHEPRADNEEMENSRLMTIGELKSEKLDIFAPFAASLDLLLVKLSTNNEGGHG